MVDDRRSVLVPHEYFEVNILGTCQLLDALGKCGVKMVVQASTRSVFGQRVDNDESLDENAARRPINPYGVSKCTTVPSALSVDNDSARPWTTTCWR